MFDYLVVGSGLFGAIFAHEAKEHEKSVILIGRRPILAVVFTLCSEGGVDALAKNTVISRVYNSE